MNVPRVSSYEHIAPRLYQESPGLPYLGIGLLQGAGLCPLVLQFHRPAAQAGEYLATLKDVFDLFLHQAGEVLQFQTENLGALAMTACCFDAGGPHAVPAGF